MKEDINFRLACNLRKRILIACKAQNVRKTIKTFDLFGGSQSFSRLFFECQLFGEITLENYAKSWCLDHCLAVASFNLSDEKEVQKCSNWIKLRAMYVKDNNFTGDKIDMRLYLLKEMKANCFMKLIA